MVLMSKEVAEKLGVKPLASIVGESVTLSFTYVLFPSFLIHGYSTGEAVNYSWDFLICIKVCSTIAIVKNPQACFARSNE